MPHYPFGGKDDLKTSFWMNILFGRVVVGCGVNQMIIRFSEASILPSVRFFVRPFLRQIVCAAWNLTKEYIYISDRRDSTRYRLICKDLLTQPLPACLVKRAGSAVYILQTQH